MARGRSSGYDDQRELILGHAAALFARSGYPGTSMNEVAQACGLSKPTIYHYFRDKYALLVDITVIGAASGAASGALSTMVAMPVPSRMVALLDALDRLTVKLSLPSTAGSLTTATVMVLLVSPGAKVSVVSAAAV